MVLTTILFRHQRISQRDVQTSLEGVQLLLEGTPIATWIRPLFFNFKGCNQTYREADKEVQSLDILRMGIRFSKQTHRKEIYVSDKNAGNLRVGHGESAKNSGNSRVEHDKSAKNVGNLRVELEKSAKNAGSSRVEHDTSAKNAGNLRVEHEKSAKNAGNSRVEHKQSDEAEQPLEILHNGEQQTKISVDVSVSNDDHVTVDKKVLVAAIDIGTSYSGYAYSFAHEQKEGKEDPDRIYVNNWENDGGSRTYFKTPSCLLLHPNGNLNCFGYEALDRYKTLLEDGKDKDVYFFMDFKMILHQEEVCDTGDCQ